MTSRFQKTKGPCRGEVWRVSFEPSVGAEITKVRPAVVLSVPTVGRLPLRIVVPVTKWDERYVRAGWLVHLPASLSSGLGMESAADAFQVKSLSVERFVSRLGQITANELQDISAAVAYCVGA